MNVEEVLKMISSQIEKTAKYTWEAEQNRIYREEDARLSALVREGKITSAQKEKELELQSQKLMETRTQETLRKIKEIFGENIELDEKKVEKLVYCDRASFNLSKLIAEDRYIEYGTDKKEHQNYASENYKEMEKVLRSIAADIALQSMNPEYYDLEFIRILKDEKEEYGVKKSLYSHYLEQYVLNTKLENIDEKLIEELYKSNYQGKFPNTATKLAYQSYCTSKGQIGKIQRLKDVAAKQDKIIKNDDGIIEDYNNEIEELNKYVSTIKEKMPEINSEILGISQKTDERGTQVAEEEKKSIFGIIANRIKKSFSKDKNQEAGKDDELIKNIEDIIEQISRCQREDINYNTKYGANHIKEKRDERNSLIQELDELKKQGIIPKIEELPQDEKTNQADYEQYLMQLTSQNISEQNISEKILESLYQTKCDSKRILDPGVRMAYEKYCVVADNNREIAGIQKEIDKNDGIINAGTSAIKEIEEKRSEAADILDTANRSLDTFSRKLEQLKTAIKTVKSQVEERNKRGIFSIISERIKNTFSKQKLLPEYASTYTSAASECKEVVEQGKNEKYEKYNVERSKLVVYQKIQLRENKKKDLTDASKQQETERDKGGDQLE